MRRVVLTEFVSLDGVMEDPGGSESYPHGGWTFTFDRGDEGNKFKLDELMNCEGLLLGRVTYDGFAAAWPQRDDPDGFARRMNDMPKWVVSSTLTDPPWNNTRVIGGDAAEGVRAVKQEDGGDMLLCGSAQLTHALLEADLVDELRLMMFPIILGEGKRVWPENPGTARRFTLSETSAVGPDGVTVAVYQRSE